MANDQPAQAGAIVGPGTIRFERLLPGPIERVWAFLTESDKRGKWLAWGEMEPEVGSDFELHFHHAELSAKQAPIPESRVDDWRGGVRSRGVAVVRPLSRSAGASVRAVAPFPVAARQTGRAYRRHPAFTGIIRPSRSAGRHVAAARNRGRGSHTDTRPDIGDIRCPLVRCVASTIVEDVVEHTSVRPCRSAEPVLG